MVMEPFPHIVIENFLPEDVINDLSTLPNYDEIDDNVYFQDALHTKKSIVDNNHDSVNYNMLLENNKTFTLFDSIFKEDNDVKDIIFDKFSKELTSNLTEDYTSFDTSTSINYSVSVPGYSKEIHVDRREHLINILLYVSDDNNSANLRLWKEINKTEICDVFPSSDEVELTKTYAPKKNTAVIMINLPWAYHSVDEQQATFLNRKYIYVVFDFEKTDRKEDHKDNNDALIWNKKVGVLNESRRQNFINLIEN